MLVRGPMRFWGGILSGVGSMIGAGINYSSQQATNQYNLAQTKQTNAVNREMFEKNLQWQKDAYQQMRSDNANAISTRVADLQKNNLNPALAIGNAAGVASAPTLPQFQEQAHQAQAPRIDNPLVGFGSITGVAGELIDMLRMKESITQSRAQTELIKADVAKRKAEAANVLGDTKLKSQQAKTLKQDEYKKSWERWEIENNTTHAARQGRSTKDSRSWFDQAESVVNKLVEGTTMAGKALWNKIRQQTKAIRGGRN